MICGYLALNIPDETIVSKVNSSSRTMLTCRQFAICDLHPTSFIRRPMSAAEAERPRKRPREDGGESPAPASNGHAAASTSTVAPAEAQAAPPPPGAQAGRPAMFDRRNRPLTRETLDKSFFCVEPHDEFTREVGDWIWGWIHNRQDVEVCIV